MRSRLVRLADGAFGHWVTPSHRQRRRREQDLAAKHIELAQIRERMGQPHLNIDLSELGAGMLDRSESRSRWRRGNPRAIDLFSGAGGFSTGAQKGGAKVVWAANHWIEAVDIHRRNHPGTLHLRQDLTDPKLDWTQVPAHEVMLASPSCKGFTRAAGARIKDRDDARNSAWAVVEAVAYHRPEVFVVENVPEMKQWDEKDLMAGRRPSRGRDYARWKRVLKSMGYRITEQIIDAADAGARMHRKRLFLVGHRGEPIHIPQPRKKHRSVREVVDLRLTPITRRSMRQQGAWSPLRPASRRRLGKKPLADRTWNWVMQGRRDFGDLFVGEYFGSTRTGRSLARPLGSQTTKSRYAIVDWKNDRIRMLNPQEIKLAMGFPADYLLPRKKNGEVHAGLATAMLGNAVSPPVAEHIMRHIRKELKRVHSRAA